MSSLRPEQLPAALERSLAPVYLLGGNEPLLLQECRDAIIRAAQAQGFTEREVIETNARFDWAALRETSAAPSLFATRRILDLRLPTGKPGRDGSRALLDLLEAPDPDVLLLVSTGEWKAETRKAKWAGALAAAGVLVEIWPLKMQQLPGWIRQRMSAAGLEADREAVGLLAELVEGNLLAAQQEIDKLALSGAGGRITAADVRTAVADSARIDVFRLVECVFSGQAAESLRAAAVLQRTGAAIQPVVAVLHRDLCVADELRASRRGGQPEDAVFRRHRIWAARQGPLRSTAQRLSERQFGDAFSTLALIDRQSKGRAAGDAWQTLDRLLWFLCSPDAVSLS
ncbi:MAG: DNA polymerase III subunit delta [Xanthomonadales bacterium]